MKRLFVVLIVAAMVVPAFAQVNLAQFQPQAASGNWVIGTDRLFQNDAAAPLARFNITVPQAGTMVYEFNVRYEGGGEDGHGGFGVQLFADTAFPTKSWGMGKSYLLWLNYDLKPLSKDIPAGLSAEVYQSLGNSKMDLIRAIDLNAFFASLKMDINTALAMTIPVKIVVNSDTGEIRIYDPTQANYYYFFTLPNFPKAGKYIALRTNGLKVSFGLPVAGM
jgi:hypothetical protein